MCLKKQKEQKKNYQNQAINKKVMSISNSFISHFWRGTRNCSYRANFNPKLFFFNSFNKDIHTFNKESTRYRYQKYLALCFYIEISVLTLLSKHEKTQK